ncbi:Dolichol phosphate-mannose biosynthesis regulatory protein [Malassezia japonica]|uniref:Dolichol phosphate-mannose biosynthesis regulatory protein n=1 Tax=Malassezia japonica TaxID=223818 RepID=A0AAF0JG73_9BASI|nr:Dolichol phosphate-mannose biosynthesis regulatory protein [Malassezia japonica]WFD39661.1 Dolichol phosphate-mannose biosynthesis regulatory protein [Malassezia japonica]
MALSDRLIGGTCLAVAVFVFVYYTLWALISPFFPDDSSIHGYFPPRVWAVRLPALLLVLGLGVIGAFVGSVMRKQAIARKEKEARKGA